MNRKINKLFNNKLVIKIISDNETLPTLNEP